MDVSQAEAFSRIWTAFDDGNILPACAWCDRVRIDDGWVVPSRAVLVAIDRRHAFSHSICDRCVDKLTELNLTTR